MEGLSYLLPDPKMMEFGINNTEANTSHRAVSPEAKARPKRQVEAPPIHCEQSSESRRAAVTKCGTAPHSGINKDDFIVVLLHES